jgi:hypothetical protein
MLGVGLETHAQHQNAVSAWSPDQSRAAKPQSEIYIQKKLFGGQICPPKSFLNSWDA